MNNLLTPGKLFNTTEKRLNEFFTDGIDACRTPEERANWHRNQKLVDFNYIPEEIVDQIQKEYDELKPNGDKMTIMNYLMENRCRNLLDELEDF